MEDVDVIEDVRSAGARLRNWGRWGAEDERGTTNLITAEKLVEAATLIKKGRVFDLGIPFDENGPQPGGGRINPVRLMSETGDVQVFPGGFKYADDYVFMPLQGGVAVGSGDILLFRTGWRKKFLADHDAVSFMAGEPGLGQACCDWLRERDVAAVASDNWAIEALPGENPDCLLNVHMILIRDMGMTLGEILDFEELASDCAADNTWDFFFCAPPLKFSRAVGSPINPLAIK